MPLIEEGPGDKCAQEVSIRLVTIYLRDSHCITFMTFGRRLLLMDEDRPVGEYVKREVIEPAGQVECLLVTRGLKVGDWKQN